MSCAETERLLDAYVDNELDVRGALEIEDHLAHCAACAGDERALRELQERTRADLVRHPLPADLETRLRGALGAHAPAATPRPGPRAREGRWRRAALLSAAAAAAIAVVAAPPLFWQRPPDVADAVVSAHVRSLLADHLTDVASSDQHTVKPWFQGKLDYSVSVTDWAPEGFALVGGRLDYVHDAPAAALVYRHAQHVVNLFVWPSRDGDQALRHLSRRGYNAFSWTLSGMRYWAVSDLNQTDLGKFVELVRAGGPRKE